LGKPDNEQEGQLDYADLGLRIDFSDHTTKLLFEVDDPLAQQLSKIQQILASKGIHEEKLRFIGKHYKDLRKEFGRRVSLGEGSTGNRESAWYRPSARTTVEFSANSSGTSPKDSPIAAIKIWWE